MVRDLTNKYRLFLKDSIRKVIDLTEENLNWKMVRAILGQPYPREAAVTFIWTAIPYRMEWRYGIAAHKVIAPDAGHVCQNLYRENPERDGAKPNS